MNIRCPEALSISSSASARSTYGLVGGYAGRNPQRDHVVRKYTTRVKMLGTFAAMVLVIGGGAAYLGATHSSTEVVHIGKARGTKVIISVFPSAILTLLTPLITLQRRVQKTKNIQIFLLFHQNQRRVVITQKRLHYKLPHIF